jgi:hypothetical protein
MSDAVSRLNAALEGRYSIERELGEGGMATVYLTEDLKHHRKIALKVLKPELTAVVGAERFLAEIQEAAEEYFGTALRQADELPHVMAQFDTRRWWAWMLLRRDASGDRQRAGELLEEAIAGYQKLEAPLFEQIATEMLGRAGG